MLLQRRHLALCSLVFLCAVVIGRTARAAEPAEIIQDLQHGGYVLLMRHASAPRTVPGAAIADPANPTHERQLDAQGRADATALGAAFRHLGIPIGTVLTSPTYRARETAQLAGIPNAISAPALGEGENNGMMKPSSPAAIAWLRHAAAEPPTAGTDTVIITHMPNIMAAFPGIAGALAAGEAIVLHPDASSDTAIGRIKIGEWSALAATRK